MQPRLIVQQKITPFANKYFIYDANRGGSPGSLVAFAQQKRFAFKEKVEFFTDESKQHLAWIFRAEKVMDIHGKMFVETSDGERIGAFRKVFGQSLIKSTWQILDAKDQPIMTIAESDALLAILRRFGGYIPFVGFVFEIITAFLKYHFSVVDTSGNEVGKYTKTTLIKDHYRLDMTAEGYDLTDWRVYASVAVALDALQSR